MIVFAVVDVAELGLLELLQVLYLFIVSFLFHCQHDRWLNLAIVKLVPVDRLEKWMLSDLIFVVDTNARLGILVQKSQEQVFCLRRYVLRDLKLGSFDIFIELLDVFCIVRWETD